MTKKVRYVARFQDGHTLTRTSARAYSHAWRVTSVDPIMRERVAELTHQTFGFSGTKEIAAREGERFARGLEENTVGLVGLHYDLAPCNIADPQEKNVKAPAKKTATKSAAKSSKKTTRAKPALQAAAPSVRAPLPPPMKAEPRAIRQTPRKAAHTTISGGLVAKAKEHGAKLRAYQQATRDVPAPAKRAKAAEPNAAFHRELAKRADARKTAARAEKLAAENKAREERIFGKAKAAKRQADIDARARDRRKAANLAALDRMAKRPSSPTASTSAPGGHRSTPSTRAIEASGKSKSTVVFEMLTSPAALKHGVTEGEICARVGWDRARSAMVRRTELAGLHLDIIEGGPGKPNRYRAIAKTKTKR